MNKITIDKKELVSIRKEIKRLINNLDGLLCGIEPGLLDEDWRTIEKMEVSLSKCLQKIKQLLNSKYK